MGYSIKLALPESNTKSFRSRPWFEKSLWSSVKLSVGAGMKLLASVTFETLPSLLPVGTPQNGPPWLDQEKLKTIIKWLNRWD